MQWCSTLKDAVCRGGEGGYAGGGRRGRCRRRVHASAMCGVNGLDTDYCYGDLQAVVARGGGRHSAAQGRGAKPTWRRWIGCSVSWSASGGWSRARHRPAADHRDRPGRPPPLRKLPARRRGCGGSPSAPGDYTPRHGHGLDRGGSRARARARVHRARLARWWAGGARRYGSSSTSRMPRNLELSAHTALSFGFQGKLCIHPKQVEPV